MLSYIFLALLIFVAVFILQAVPISSEKKDLERLSDTNNIRRNLEAIVNTSSPRNYLNVDVLDSVAAHIKSEFAKSTSRVTVQEFGVAGKSYRNVIASFGPENAERIIVGAHYDVCGEQPGADDNASGVVGVLELARLLKDKELKYRIDLVAYTLEEPPFFRTENMGSFVHAKSLHDSNAQVKGMICLEMIGYYSDEENSQHYPVGFLKWFYGDKGNFITIVQKPMNGSFARQFKKLTFKNNSIVTKSFNAPSFFGGIDLSDHRNYWKFGYSAVMVTNTAFFRNANYHSADDALHTLNVPKIGLVIDGVFRSLMEMQ